MSNPASSELQAEALSFRDRFKTVVLATCDVNAEPHASYAPFIVDQSGAFYIFVSELAPHTCNLLSNPRASLLLIDAEAQSTNLFARQRLSLTCRAAQISRNTPHWSEILDRMFEAHGKTVELLRTLPDFHLYRLDVTTGDYIKGFGQAYRVTGNSLNVQSEPRRR